jgi:hypothetical protein
MRVEADHWGPGPSILAAETLAALRSALEETLLIVEHRYYRGSRSPGRYIFEEFELLEEHLREHGRPGDAFWVWRFDQLCRDDTALTHAKIPDEDGTVPTGGAY